MPRIRRRVIVQGQPHNHIVVVQGKVASIKFAGGKRAPGHDAEQNNVDTQLTFADGKYLQILKDSGQQ